MTSTEVFCSRAVAMALVLGGAFVGGVMATPYYTITDLGSLGGTTVNAGLSINGLFLGLMVA